MKRKAQHAGSWYQSNAQLLSRDLDAWLSKVNLLQHVDGKEISPPIPGVRAIIAPHAGLRYSGQAAAYAYKSVDVSDIKRVFILGPSHHAYIDGCALSYCDAYETPMGDLVVDQKINDELHGKGHFSRMSLSVDEDEHSIEMHLPYIYKIMESAIHEVTIVPVLVGSLQQSDYQDYGKIFSSYLSHPENLFVISSDFCHYGHRFSYRPFIKHALQDDDQHESSLSLSSSPCQSSVSEYVNSKIADCDTKLPMWKCIEHLDQEGMDIIEAMDLDAFQLYLQHTKNTICGRNPICILLSALRNVNTSSPAGKKCDAVENKNYVPQLGDEEEGHVKPKSSHKMELDGDAKESVFVKFVYYQQSSKCLTAKDSSVSYASAFVSFLE